VGFREPKVGVEEIDFFWLNSRGLESGYELRSGQFEECVEWAYLAEVQDLGGPADLSHNRKCGGLNNGAQRRMRTEVSWVVRQAALRFFVSCFDTLAPPISGFQYEGPRVRGVEAAGKATVVEESGSGLQGFCQKLGLGESPVQDGCCRAPELMGFHKAEACSGKGLLKKERRMLWGGA
jgi:hypothetical protein